MHFCNGVSQNGQTKKTMAHRFNIAAGWPTSFAQDCKAQVIFVKDAVPPLIERFIALRLNPVVAA